MGSSPRKYQAFRHFMVLSGSPGFAGMHLHSMENMARDDKKWLSDEMESDRVELDAVLNPPPEATVEQMEFIRQTMEARDRLRALEEAGAKTPYDEGCEAFDLKREIAGQEQADNPYPDGSYEHGWWDTGMSDATFEAYQDGRIPDDDEVEKDREADTLDSYRDRFIDLAREKPMNFLGVCEI